MRPPWAWHRRALRLPPARGELGSDAPICVVHLVRAANGLDSLRAFADALRSHPPGSEHDLVFAMKGFRSPDDAKPYLQEVSDLPHRALFFPDRGFDLGVYFAVAGMLRSSRYCFLNSHARPLVDGWLAKLDAALDQPSVGQVGATGSWTSSHSWIMYSLGLPSGYRGLLPPLPVAREEIMDIQLERLSLGRRSLLNSLRVRAEVLPRLPEEIFGFEPFPTPHLRPNSFMITHEVLKSLQLFTVRSKMDTYVLESGRGSITNQLKRLGLISQVVDSAGIGYGPELWDRSYTFWQGDQKGLLVADNQTRIYANGTQSRRRVLSTVAWGLKADPGVKTLGSAEPHMQTLDRKHMW
jgi:hypothetical protein